MNDTTSLLPDDFLPSASLETLRLRSRLLQTLRRTFEENGYWEVETPLLSHETIIDAHLEPMRVAIEAAARDLFLQTSPELGMKRLIAGGADAIFQITRALRAGEVGQFHNPEFTLVEWYQTGTTYHEQMNFTERLVTRVLEEAIVSESRGTDPVSPLAILQELQPGRSFVRMSYNQAFERFTGTPVLHLSAKELAHVARRHRVMPPESLRQDDRDEWLNLLLAELVEPHLGFDRPVFVYDYPASQSALARVRNEEPPVAERFELYIRGMELCNGYDELTDSDELRARMTRQNGLRSRENRAKLPMPLRLLNAHDCGLPPCSGVALGFDRLIMLCVGATSIAEVLAFPFDRA